MIDILEYLGPNEQNKPHLIFLNAKKAFTNLNWTFLFKVLEHMNFGENFRKWVQLSYTSWMMQIAVNGDLTKPCEIQRGIIQGCQLSLFTFILVLEILNKHIRQDNRIVGTKI